MEHAAGWWNNYYIQEGCRRSVSLGNCLCAIACETDHVTEKKWIKTRWKRWMWARKKGKAKLRRSPRGCMLQHAWVYMWEVSATHSFKRNPSVCLSHPILWFLFQQQNKSNVSLRHCTGKRAPKWFVTVLTTEEWLHPKAEMVTLKFNWCCTMTVSAQVCSWMKADRFTFTFWD